MKSFLGNFYRHFAIFSGHTDDDRGGGKLINFSLLILTKEKLFYDEKTAFIEKKL